MQYSESIRTTLGLENPAEVLAALFRAQGDQVSVRDNEITQTTWKLMNGLEAESLTDWMDGLRGLWEGVVSVTDPDLRLELLDRLDTGGNCFRWRCSPISEPSKY
jgi:hypothetical protein